MKNFSTLDQVRSGDLRRKAEDALVSIRLNVGIAHDLARRIKTETDGPHKIRDAANLCELAARAIRLSTFIANSMVWNENDQRVKDAYEAQIDICENAYIGWALLDQVRPNNAVTTYDSAARQLRKIAENWRQGHTPTE